MTLMRELGAHRMPDSIVEMEGYPEAFYAWAQERCGSYAMSLSQACQQFFGSIRSAYAVWICLDVPIVRLQSSPCAGQVYTSQRCPPDGGQRTKRHECTQGFQEPGVECTGRARHRRQGILPGARIRKVTGVRKPKRCDPSTLPVGHETRPIPSSEPG